jgi:O-acetylhomoserine/O-acetylserine sulfhydrylase-like pyridoxal-dependent enzyme
MTTHFKTNEGVKAAELEALLIHAGREWNATSAVILPIYQTADFYGTPPDDSLERSSRPRLPEFYTRYRSPNAAPVESVLEFRRG